MSPKFPVGTVKSILRCGAPETAGGGGEVIDHLRQHPRQLIQSDPGKAAPHRGNRGREHILQPRLRNVEGAIHSQGVDVRQSAWSSGGAAPRTRPCGKRQMNTSTLVRPPERLDRGRAGIAEVAPTM